MEKINACLKLCYALIEAIEKGELEPASNLSRQLTEQADGVQTSGPDGRRDGAVVSNPFVQTESGARQWQSRTGHGLRPDSSDAPSGTGRMGQLGR